MKLEQRDRWTGLIEVKETRKREFWRALPRKVKERAVTHDEAAEGTPWYPKHHEFNGQTLIRVRCWKCGRDLKGWRAMLDPHKIGFRDGQPIQYSEANLVKVAGKPAVAFLTLPHATSTPIAVYLPLLKEKIVFPAQHCLDCQIQNVDAENLLCCFLAGADAILWNAWNHKSASTLSADQWANHLFRYHQAEPVGVASEEDAMNNGVPAPGELITAAQVMVNTDLAKRSAMPSGVEVDYHGQEEPPGWIFHPEKPGRIIKL